MPPSRRGIGNRVLIGSFVDMTEDEKHPLLIEEDRWKARLFQQLREGSLRNLKSMEIGWGINWLVCEDQLLLLSLLPGLEHLKLSCYLLDTTYGLRWLFQEKLTKLRSLEVRASGLGVSWG